MKDERVLRARGISLDSDFAPDFEPVKVQHRHRSIHLPEDFYTKPLPATLSRPPPCTCPQCTSDLNLSAAGSLDEPLCCELPHMPGLPPIEWSTPLRFFLQMIPFEQFETLAQNTNEYANARGAGKNARPWRPTSAGELLL